MRRNIIATILFLMLTTALVTAPTLLNIQNKKQQIQSSMTTIKVSSQTKTPKISAKNLSLEIQKLAEKSNLSQNALTMESIRFGKTDTFEFDLDYSGNYENVCGFIESLQQIENAIISNVTIYKPQEKEKISTYTHRINLRVAFTGVA